MFGVVKTPDALTATLDPNSIVAKTLQTKYVRLGELTAESHDSELLRMIRGRGRPVCR